MQFLIVEDIFYNISTWTENLLSRQISKTKSINLGEVIVGHEPRLEPCWSVHQPT